VTVDEFVASLEKPTPPKVSPALVALWHDAKGNWHEAHEVAQEIDDATGAWVHAYLHRKEGDLGNAGYWYRRAGKPIANGSVEDEWREIVAAFLLRRLASTERDEA
jgi:hypothetical protein